MKKDVKMNGSKPRFRGYGSNHQGRSSINGCGIPAFDGHLESDLFLGFRDHQWTDDWS